MGFCPDPTSSGRTLGDRLVLEGTDRADLRFVTPLDIAIRMGARFVVEQGIHRSALIMKPIRMTPELHAHRASSTGWSSPQSPTNLGPSSSSRPLKGEV